MADENQPSSSQHGASHIVSGSIPKRKRSLPAVIDLEPTLEDSRSYVSAVRGILGEENLTVFKENMLEFRNGRIGHDLICDRMAQLLNGHRVLAYGFNQFLPGGFGVVLTEESDYAQRVKERFEDDKGRYISFVHVMRDFKRGRVSTEYVCRKVITLFDGHYDLIEEFGKFVPPTEPEP